MTASSTTETPPKIADTFKALQSQNRAAFIPFFTAGDPDYETTELLLLEADKRGADIIEVGVPFSDPVADGPTIQESYFRALENGFTIDGLFQLIRNVRSKGLKKPLVCMASYTLGLRRGVQKFCSDAKDAGFSGIMFPDLPLGYEEAAANAAANTDLDLILFSAPTTSENRRKSIAGSCKGFLYYFSVTGITGERNALPEDLEANVKKLKAEATVPVCVGFGISTPEQAAQVSSVADGAIVGSALVRRVTAALKESKSSTQIAEDVGEFIESLATAVHQTSK